MRLRITSSRSAAGLLLLALLLASPLPASRAVAQSGNGLYEPFPEAAVKKRAQRYVEGLRSRTAEPGRRYSDAELAEGAFVRAGPGAPTLVAPRANPTRAGANPTRAGSDAPPPGAGPATARAGGQSGSSSGDDLALPWQLLLLSLALTAPAAVIVKRARTRAA